MKEIFESLYWISLSIIVWTLTVNIINYITNVISFRCNPNTIITSHQINKEAEELGSKIGLTILLILSRILVFIWYK